MAAQHYRARGFRVEARNLKIGGHEIDLVVRSGALLVLVEVRYRGHTAYESPLASISPKKRKRILGAANRLWQRVARDRTLERFRIDIASVVSGDDGAFEVEIIAGAITG